MSSQKKWQIWIDTGGTFTDCIAIDPRGKKMRTKVLSSSRLRGRLLEQRSAMCFRFSQNWRMARRDIFAGYDFLLLTGEIPPNKVVRIDWEQEELWLEAPLSFSGAIDFEITAYEEAPVLATRLITGTPLDRPLPPLDMRLGSTKGTNALLERKGARVAFLVTKGFADLIAIGTQQRPYLFQLDIPEPPILYEQVIEVEERLDAEGRVVTPLTSREIGRLIAELQAAGCDAVAVALLHAYRNPVHELKIREALQKANIQFVSLSHALTPSIKILPRAQTALVNAYLSPIIHDYLSGIQAKAGSPASTLRVMTSAGGLIGSSNFHPKDSLLSGPAGGVVGAARLAGQLGFHQVLTLDMGGTSTDTARYDGSYDYQFITHIDRIEMISPALSIETVAARVPPATAPAGR
jgi:5-oxoprolinase (ATP-hydrolysing)